MHEHDGVDDDNTTLLHVSFSLKKDCGGGLVYAKIP